MQGWKKMGDQCSAPVSYGGARDAHSGPCAFACGDLRPRRMQDNAIVCRQIRRRETASRRGMSGRLRGGRQRVWNGRWGLSSPELCACAWLRSGSRLRFHILSFDGFLTLSLGSGSGWIGVLIGLWNPGLDPGSGSASWIQVQSRSRVQVRSCSPAVWMARRRGWTLGDFCPAIESMREGCPFHVLFSNRFVHFRVRPPCLFSVCLLEGSFLCRFVHRGGVGGGDSFWSAS